MSPDIVHEPWEANRDRTTHQRRFSGRDGESSRCSDNRFGEVLGNECDRVRRSSRTRKRKSEFRRACHKSQRFDDRPHSLA